MRVLFNATEAVLAKRAIWRYVAALGRGLPVVARAERDEVIRLAFLTHHYLQVKSFTRSIAPQASYEVCGIWRPRRLLARRFDRPHPQLSRLADGMDLYHEPGFDTPNIVGIPVVTTIHGLAHQQIPHLLPRSHVEWMQAWFDRVVDRSDYFIAVSDTTAKKLADHAGIDSERIRSIPLGISPQFQPLPFHRAVETVKSRFGVGGRYLLYAGGVQRRRNIPLLLSLFGRLVKERRFEGTLVLAGKLHYPPDVFRRMVDRTGVSDRIRHLGFIDPVDPGLAMLYRGASVFLYPTSYEGWTAPPLEAMACGTPVITSDVPSVRETVDDGAVCLDPRDEDGWLEACERLLEDLRSRSDLKEAGLMRAARFSWDRMIQRTWSFYTEIARGPVKETADLQTEVSR